MGHGDRSLLALPAKPHHLRRKGDARYLGGYHRPGNAGRRGGSGADFRIDGRLCTPGVGPGVCHAHGRRRGGYARGLPPGRDAARQVRVSRVRRAVRARQYGVPRAGTTREGLAMARQRRCEPRGDAGRCGRGRAHSSVVTDRWDVVVVGAGPAGATTALLLARAGASVLLVDRARFPRDKACSEYLSPATTEILERLGGGILDAVEGAAHAKLYGMKVVAPCGATMCGRFRGGPRPYSFALPRTTFDTILVAAAARAGAEVRQATTVENLLWEGGAVAGVTARSCNPKGLPDGRGQGVTCNARIVVGADGLRSVVARRLGHVRSSSPRRVAFTAHVRGVGGMAGAGRRALGPMPDPRPGPPRRRGARALRPRAPARIPREVAARATHRGRRGVARAHRPGGAPPGGAAGPRGSSGERDREHRPRASGAKGQRPRPIPLVTTCPASIPLSSASCSVASRPA